MDCDLALPFLIDSHLALQEMGQGLQALHFSRLPLIFIPKGQQVLDLGLLPTEILDLDLYSCSPAFLPSPVRCPPAWGW